MKAINITPEVFRLMEDIRDKKVPGCNAAAYAIDKALDTEKLQVFKETDTNLFWFENHDAPKYAVAFIRTRLINDKKMVYRDDWKKDKTPIIKKVVSKVLKKEEPKKEEKDLNLASPDDLKLFVDKYMSDYKMSAKFKTLQPLKDEAMMEFFAEIRSSYTTAITTAINKIYGGEKPNYRTKNKMTDEERKLFEQNTRKEFEWFFDNLVWLAEPSKKYIQEHKKFSTHNYMTVAADLSSCVSNSLYQYRTLKAF